MLDVNPEKLIILRSLIAIAAALAGALIASGGKKVSHSVLCGLVSFAAGALLAVTIINIMPETFEMIGVFWSLVFTVVGFIIFVLIGKYVYYVCPACAASATENSGGFVRLGILMMAAMSIHSTVDGLAISAGSKAAETSASMVGIMILFAVSYHKIPEGMALMSVARLAGYSRLKALGITFLIELTTALGAIIGLLLLSGGISELWIGITLGIVAGSFLYTVGFALLKEMYAHEKNSIIIFAVLGFVSIAAINFIMKHFGFMMHSH